MVSTQLFLIFIQFVGEDFQFDNHFSDGLVQPPTNNQRCILNVVKSHVILILRLPQGHADHGGMERRSVGGAVGRWWRSPVGGWWVL